MDMSYTMDFAENWLYTTFPNIFLLISAESADLLHNQKNHFFEKKRDFLDQKCALKKPNRGQYQNHASPKSA